MHAFVISRREVFTALQRQHTPSISNTVILEPIFRHRRLQSFLKHHHDPRCIILLDFFHKVHLSCYVGGNVTLISKCCLKKRTLCHKIKLISQSPALAPNQSWHNKKLLHFALCNAGSIRFVNDSRWKEGVFSPQGYIPAFNTEKRSEMWNIQKPYHFLWECIGKGEGWRCLLGRWTGVSGSLTLQPSQALTP